MTEKRFEIIGVGYTNIDVPTYIVEYGNGEDDCFNLYESKEDSQKVVDLLNELNDENEQLKQQRKDLLRLIDNNIEIYENINTNVEFHKGEIQGKLTLLYNLRKVILND